MDTINIINFEKFNPRKDRKEHSWFRLDNTIAFSEDLFGLDADQKWFWIYLLSFESKKQSGSIDLNWEYLEQYSGVSIKKMKAAIAHFEKRGMIQIVPHSVTTRLPDGNQSVTNGSPTDRQTLQDNTDNTDTTLQQTGEVLSPAEILVLHWNTLTDAKGQLLPLPKVEKISDERKDKIRSRLKKIKLDDLTRAMDKIRDYPFLLGAGEKGWLVDFDWVIANDTNYLKILEGKYRNSGLKVVSQTQKNFDHTAEQARRVAAGEL